MVTSIGIFAVCSVLMASPTPLTLRWKPITPSMRGSSAAISLTSSAVRRPWAKLVPALATSTWRRGALETPRWYSSTAASSARAPTNALSFSFSATEYSPNSTTLTYVPAFLASALLPSILATRSFMSFEGKMSSGAGPSAFTTPTHSVPMRSTHDRPPQCAFRSCWMRPSRTTGPISSSAITHQ